jgi:plasmid stability protein
MAKAVKQMTIRGLPDEVASRLARTSRERGQSLNTTVVEILKQAVDVNSRRARLERYVTWTDRDLEEFSETLAAQRVVYDWKAADIF